MTLQHLQRVISTGLPPTMSVEDAAQLLGISRTMVYTEAARYRDTDGRQGLPNVRLGGRVLVLTALLLDHGVARRDIGRREHLADLRQRHVEIAQPFDEVRRRDLGRLVVPVAGRRVDVG